jgi:hypothetical protein
MVVWKTPLPAGLVDSVPSSRACSTRVSPWRVIVPHGPWMSSVPSLDAQSARLARNSVIIT